MIIYNHLFVLLAATFFSFVQCNKETINQKNYEVCSGMYSAEDWHGKVDPYISFNLKKISGDGSTIVAIYDFQDFEHLGVELDDGERHYICDDYALEMGYCDVEQSGQFIITDVVYDPWTKTNKTLVNPIVTFTQSAVGLHDKKYPITKTGFYCVTAFESTYDMKFNAVVNFRNAYGQLAGSEINKLPLYGLLAIGYVIAMALYSFAFWKHKHELLPLQKYLLAFYVFLTAETIFVWAYYDIKNEKGDTAGTKVYMVLLSILTGGKVTFSFFLLLIIALGYGIVYPKLNKTLMRRCQIYAALSYCVCIAFLIQSYLADPENPSSLILITFIPLALSMFAFYFMIIRSMTNTVKYLKEQRQIVKLNMYRKLLLIIYGSLLIMLLGFVVTSFIFMGRNTIDMIEKDWRSRFFFTDFWPTLVYFCVFVLLSFIWRPTDTSYMLAVSQQLPTDPENVADFDLSDLQSLGEPLASDLEDEHDNMSIITEEQQLPGRNNATSNQPQDNHLDLDFSDEEINLSDDEHHHNR
ncbi:hypothetical protein KAFR_0B01440 [Kazachstania africana CBS 2517]|uniref:Membrane protein PTM1 n=1 Tax=Kazachstania africana (strain ATCC 22294 / BCRC 22015 / CBS 2517 / CECT 1963 / NBRC 1671 / NRRL Y-8276) TaxID=1071382 RepID=H2APZ3_KAZAF|nr:hypothetical protein KAFR_0B01440 [Kazachstania africana CBS 2517]CCF56443.1 hypothetical protein KAFR_0B01440 [Kazachstania africana CBS 2517]